MVWVSDLNKIHFIEQLPFELIVGYTAMLHAAIVYSTFNITSVRWPPDSDNAISVAATQHQTALLREIASIELTDDVMTNQPTTRPSLAAIPRTETPNLYTTAWIKEQMITTSNSRPRPKPIFTTDWSVKIRKEENQLVYCTFSSSSVGTTSLTLGLLEMKNTMSTLATNGIKNKNWVGIPIQQSQVLKYRVYYFPITRETFKVCHRICQRKMERRNLNKQLSNRTSNVDLRKRTGMQYAAIQAQQLKWRWARHAMRMHQGRWTYTRTWDPREGERNRGRPRCRWSDDFRRSAKKRERYNMTNQQSIFSPKSPAWQTGKPDSYETFLLGEGVNKQLLLNLNLVTSLTRSTLFPGSGTWTKKTSILHPRYMLLNLATKREGKNVLKMKADSSSTCINKVGEVNSVGEIPPPISCAAWVEVAVPGPTLWRPVLVQYFLKINTPILRSQKIYKLIKWLRMHPRRKVKSFVSQHEYHCRWTDCVTRQTVIQTVKALKWCFDCTEYNVSVKVCFSGEQDKNCPNDYDPQQNTISSCRSSLRVQLSIAKVLRRNILHISIGQNEEASSNRVANSLLQIQSWRFPPNMFCISFNPVFFIPIKTLHLDFLIYTREQSFAVDGTILRLPVPKQVALMCMCVNRRKYKYMMQQYKLYKLYDCEWRKCVS
ncbi:hypothetical protein C0J52_13197 [Blattella germanica]|nr:hypothetical protein C0J52_13197 [Blattella germanica]